MNENNGGVRERPVNPHINGFILNGRLYEIHEGVNILGPLT